MTRVRRVPILCPTCGKAMARIVDTRPWQSGILRRRECPDKHRATTLERPFAPDLDTAA
jgi:transcriptional regulator NrdR family protein